MATTVASFGDNTMALKSTGPSPGSHIALVVAAGVFVVISLIVAFHAANTYPTLRKNLQNHRLYQAIITNDVAGTKNALDRGADVNSRDDNGKPMLYVALAESHVDAARILLRYHPDVNAITHGSHATLLMGACGAGAEDIVETLIAYGADVNAQSHDGTTALSNAARGDYAAIVSYLLSQGADPALVDLHGKTVLTVTQKRYDETTDPKKKARIYRVLSLLRKAKGRSSPGL